MRKIKSRAGRGSGLHAVYGSVRGLKESQNVRLEQLALRRIPSNRVLTQETARYMTEISAELRRQVGVLVDRQGNICGVLVEAVAKPLGGCKRAISRMI